MQEGAAISSRPEGLTQEILNTYIGKFLEISDFKAIENGKGLLELVRNYPDHTRIKSAIRKVIGLFSCEVPAGRVCALQFLKEAVETGCFYVVEYIEKSLMSQFAEILEYRSNVASLQRGSSYFIREYDKNIEDDELKNLMRLSSTFFRMVHECVYVWGAIYFPKSLFDKLRQKYERKINFPEFPSDFKFFSQTKINSFKANCKGLIKRVEERMLAAAETASVLSKRSLSKAEEKSNLSSPRNIKKTKQPPKMQREVSANLFQANKRLEEEQQKELEKQSLAHPIQSQRLKKRKPKNPKSTKKPFIQTHEQPEEKIIQNNSSKLRKKNSFNEVPFGKSAKTNLPESLSNQSSTEHHHKSKAPSIEQNQINSIPENQQSQGGRYSIQQTISKQSKESEQSDEISEILYEYNRDKELSSPRSQYSLMNKESKELKLKRENSEQLPSAKPISKKAFVKVDTQIKMEPRANGKNILEKPPISNKKSLQKPQDKSSRQKHFNLPLNTLKDIGEKQNQQNFSKTERQKEQKLKKGELSARKKFVSSEEESQKEIKQSPKQQLERKLVLLSKLDQNDGFDYQKTPKRQQKHYKPQITSMSKEEMIQPMSISPPKAKEANNTQILNNIPPAKVSKPMKIKSNSNLKTVFQSTDFKMVEHKQPLEPKPIKTKQTVEEAKSKKGAKSIEKAPSLQKQAKRAQKISIFEAVSIDTIQTINEVPSIPYKESRIQQPIGEGVESDSSSNELKQPQQLLNTGVTVQKMFEASQQNIRANVKSVSYSIPDDSTHRETIEKVRQNTERQHQNLQIGTKQANQTSRQRIVNDKEAPRNIKAIRNDAVYSSRRFRQFKEVNLQIEPKTPYPTQQSQKSDDPRLPTDQSFQNALKEQLFQEFSRLKSTILEKQEENFNQTVMTLKSSIERKGSIEIGVECSTQTKLRHKSKGKFQRKGKYSLLGESRDEQNTSDLNLPQVPNARDQGQTFKLNNIQNKLQPENRNSISKKSIAIQKEELKPNTLLYALYKRKSIHI